MISVPSPLLIKQRNSYGRRTDAAVQVFLVEMPKNLHIKERWVASPPSDIVTVQNPRCAIILTHHFERTSEAAATSLKPLAVRGRKLNAQTQTHEAQIRWVAQSGVYWWQLGTQ